MADEIRVPKKAVFSFEVEDVIEVDEVSINLTPVSNSPASALGRLRIYIKSAREIL